MKRLLALFAAPLVILAMIQPASASSCAGVVTTSPYVPPPTVYQLSSLSVNTPTYRVGITIPWGYPTAPLSPPSAPTLIYSFTTTYLGPTYFGWIGTSYLTGDVHVFGPTSLIMVVPDFIGYVSTSYVGTCPVP